MKTKSMLFALILCLFTSLFCFACEADDIDDDSSGVHMHTYVEVAEVASTCVEQGTKAHYKCGECEKLFLKEGAEYTEVSESDLKLALAAHTFDGIEVKTNPTKAVYSAFDPFDLTGIEVVKHCAVVGCAGEAVAAENVTFEYAIQGATALTADMQKVVIKAEGYSVDLAVKVNKIKVTLPTIASKEYTGAEQTADVTVDEETLYTVTENNGGTDIGLYDVVLTLKDAVNYEFNNEEGAAVIDGATATVKFEITKTANEITMPESIATITCGQTPVINATAKEDAAISYVYSATEDGEYTATIEGGFVAGTYYVKAVAAESANYKQTTSAATSFTVTHAFDHWNTEDADADTGVCVCGHALTDIFNKKVTDARQDVILKDASGDKTAFAITLGGIEGTVKSVAYGELALGSDITALTVSEELVNATHGEQNLTVVVTDSYNLDHTVLVPVTIVTESISTFTRLVDCVTYKNTRGNIEGVEDLYQQGKYFIIANDLTTNTYNVTGELRWAYAGRGFAGTLDGRYNTISGGYMYGGGLFGAIYNGVVKNITFDNVEIYKDNRSLITGSMYNTTLENITMNFTDKATVTSVEHFFGILASHPAKNITLKNIKINAPGATFPFVIGSHSQNGNVNDYHCENVEIIAASVDCFTTNGTTKLYLDQVPGVTFKLSGKVAASDTVKIDPKQFADEDNYTYSYTFDGWWAKYTAIKSVKLGEKDITEYTNAEQFNGGELMFGLFANYITEEMFNKNITFTVEFDAGEGNTVVLDITNVGVLSRNEQVTLETCQDVVLKDSSGDKGTFTLNLGDYNDVTITGVIYNSETLTVAENVITVSDAMKNGTHGEGTMVVTAVKGNAIYEINVPVTVITEVIYDWTTLLYNCQYNTANSANSQTTFGAGKYYILGQNIDGSTVYSFTHNGTYYNMEWGGFGKGFAGTLDGRGNTIKNINLNGNGGLFSGINGATIKKVNFDISAFSSNNSANAVFASNVQDATLEDITITFSSGITLTGRAMISGQQLFNTKLTNITIHAEGLDISYLLGTATHADNPNNVCTNVTVYANSLAMISLSQTAKDGVEFYKMATRE